ncbi:DUF1778 domain-containing protein, partial [Dysosmobacter welbionis]
HQEPPAPDPVRRQRRCPDAGGHPLPDADGQDQCGAGPLLGERAFVYFRLYGPHHWWGHCQFRL